MLMPLLRLRALPRHADGSRAPPPPPPIKRLVDV